MSLEAGIRSLLLSSEEVTGLVGTNAYNYHLPDSAGFPAITYFIVSEAPFPALSGKSRTFEALIQVSCWGDTYGDARKTGLAVREALSGRKLETDSINIQALLEDQTITFHPESESGLWHIAGTYETIYTKKE